MSAHHRDALLKARFGEKLACVQIIQRVLENPWIVKRSSPDAYAGAARVFKHNFGALRRGDITITDHWSMLHRLNHCSNAVQVDSATKSLLACAPVHENGRHTYIRQGPRKIRRTQILFVP